MIHDVLTDLLREADASAPPPPAPQGVAEHVRGRAGIQARRRRATAVVVLPLTVAGVAVLLLRERTPLDPSPHVMSSGAMPSAPAGSPAPLDAAASLAEVRRLRSEAAGRLAVAQGLTARRELRRRAAEALALSDAARATSLSREREKAALTLLDHADRLRRDLKEVDAALAAYRRTVELFPDTAWAAVARRRIEELQPDARRVTTGSSLT